MKKLIISVVIALTLVSVIVEAQRANRKAPQPAVEGAVMKGNRATAKAGYEFVRQSDNDVVLRKKKKKTPDPPKGGDIVYAHYRCSCQRGGGGCSVATNGQSIFCDKGSCTECGLTVTLDPKGAIGISQ